jgi:hypothetical protein
MPYFKRLDKNANILFIEIPYNCGDCVKDYISKKFNIPKKSIYENVSKEIIEKYGLKYNNPDNMSYNLCMFLKNEFAIDENNLKIIAIVRNPYERILIILYFLRKITKQSTEREINNELKLFLLDNHYLNQPQYYYVIDSNGNVDQEKIKILKKESLQNDMHNLGYNDFIQDICEPDFNINEKLNRESLDLINRFYHLDFEYFQFNKL